jgi:8-amino-7-oxononanoate synthase
MLVSSLAKAFGVPLTVVAGNQAAVERFVRLSDTRVHCSPPAMSALRAARRALAINVTRGDRLRRRLAANVLRFRSRLVEAGFAAIGGAFPVQTILLPPDADAGRVHDDLERAGIRTVLRRGGRTGGPLLTFIVNAQHAPRDLDRATEQLSSIVTPPRRVAREVRSHDA